MSSTTRSERAPLVAGLVLAAGVLWLYAPIWSHGFVEWDDALYVTANAHVREGLSVENLRWAFTNAEAFLWHPLTWLSFLASAELHGVEAAGPWLATNAALHAFNTLVALAALWALTASVPGPGRATACTFAAGVFAWHPLQVESVAWVSARKELLAASFVCLTLLAYARYARAPSPRRYALVLLGCALGAMAKGSHVALPFVLLLFDAWPLRRVTGADRAALRRLVWEKVPLLAVQLAAVGANYALARQAANVWGSDPALATRIGAVLVNLSDVLRRIAWPDSLAIVYPNALQPIHPPASADELAGAIAVLLSVTLLAAASRRARGPLLVGWLGFLALLLPMSGIVPMGLRSPHDRYLMVPLLWLATGAAFGLRALAGTSPVRRRALAAAGAVLLVAFAVGTRLQVPVWHDSDTLFAHALRVVGDDPIVHYSRGTARARIGAIGPARADLEHAVALHPDYADAHHNLGLLLLYESETARARRHLERAVALRPGWGRALLHLAMAEQQAGDTDAALATYARAVEAEPSSVAAQAARGVALLAAGRAEEAEEALRAALALDPEHAEAREALGRLERSRAESGRDG